MNTLALVTAILSGICMFAFVLGNYAWIRNERRKLLSRNEQNTEDASVFGDLLLPGTPWLLLVEIKLLPHTVRTAAAMWRADNGFKVSLAIMLISAVACGVSTWFLF
jgi:hypothetical protein